MALDVKYVSDEDGVVVTVGQTHPDDDAQPGVKRYRKLRKDFGKGEKAEDAGVIFVHGVLHGDIKPDDILPPWRA